MFVSKSDFEKMCFKDPYFMNRWGYMSHAIFYSLGVLKSIKNPKILEIGSNDFPLCKFSETMDVVGEPTYKMDVCDDWDDLPDYDLIIALQVWEHLEDPKLAFKNVLEHTDNVILSLPYKWNCPGNCHHMIDEKTIFEWTGLEPYISAIIDKKRIMNVYMR
jgi:hypothetical protein